MKKEFLFCGNSDHAIFASGGGGFLTKMYGPPTMPTITKRNVPPPPGLGKKVYIWVCYGSVIDLYFGIQLLGGSFVKLNSSVPIKLQLKLKHPVS